jgi:hypothetical protein
MREQDHSLEILFSLQSGTVDYFGQGWTGHCCRQQMVPALSTQNDIQKTVFVFSGGVPIFNVYLSTNSEQMPDAVLSVGGERHVKSSFAMDRLRSKK